MSLREAFWRAWFQALHCLPSSQKQPCPLHERLDHVARLIMMTVLGLTHLRPTCVSHSVSDRARKTQRPIFCQCCTVLQGEFRVGGPSEVDVAAQVTPSRCRRSGAAAVTCISQIGGKRNVEHCPQHPSQHHPPPPSAEALGNLTYQKCTFGAPPRPPALSAAGGGSRNLGWF